MSKLSNFFQNLFLYQEKEDYQFNIPKNNNNIPTSHLPQQKNIYPSLDVNLEYMKTKFNSLINSDISIREFTLLAQNKEHKAFLFYIDGMVDTKLINDFILKPLMLRNRANTHTPDKKVKVTSAIANNISVRRMKKFNLEDYIFNSLVPQNTIKKVSEFEKIISDINMGNCALFVDTLSVAFSLEVKGFKARSIPEPNNEIIIRGSQEAFVEVIRTNTSLIRGPQEAFVENIRTNTSLIRRIINNENLIIENASVGKVTNTPVAICYMKEIANDALVAEVKYRIQNLKIDSLTSSGQLEQLIQDNDKVIFPQILSTERPDRASRYILAGRVVVIVNGSPYALVMPATFMDFLSSQEDTNIRYQYANLLKIIRGIALFLALLLPGLYIAISNYHQELIPTELLFAIVSSRASVPFPVILEILIMEVSFELIREAGVRVPSPLGPTIGIVGALILGQAAVSASIVSPILIIIISITGICSFTVPDFFLGFWVRIYRFIYIIAGYLGGFLGIAFVLFIQFLLLLGNQSFGIPYLSLHLPFGKSARRKSYFLSPMWKREKRETELNTKRPNAQEHISMTWKDTRKE